MHRLKVIGLLGRLSVRLVPALWQWNRARQRAQTAFCQALQEARVSPAVIDELVQSYPGFSLQDVSRQVQPR